MANRLQMKASSEASRKSYREEEKAELHQGKSE